MRSKRSVIDLRDYVCPNEEPDNLERWEVRLRDSAKIQKPCGILGHCPYGDLAEVFPKSSRDAQQSGWPHPRFPLTCFHTKRHCPAYYLVEIDHQDPFARCWESNGGNECAECADEPEVCPHGVVWRRKMLMASDAVALDARDRLSCEEWRASVAESRTNADMEHSSDVSQSEILS